MLLQGIGKLTAEYIALRALGDTNVFPEGDVFLGKIVKSDQVEQLSPWKIYLDSGL